MVTFWCCGSSANESKNKAEGLICRCVMQIIISPQFSKSVLGQSHRKSSKSRFIVHCVKGTKTSNFYFGTMRVTLRSAWLWPEVSNEYPPGFRAGYNSDRYENYFFMGFRAQETRFRWDFIDCDLLNHSFNISQSVFWVKVVFNFICKKS